MLVQYPLKDFSERNYPDAPSKTQLRKFTPGSLIAIERADLRITITCKVLYRRADNVLAEIVDEKSGELGCYPQIYCSVNHIKTISPYIPAFKMPTFMSVCLGSAADEGFIIHNNFPRFLAQVQNNNAQSLNVIYWYDVPESLDKTSEILQKAHYWYQSLLQKIKQ